MAPTLTFIYGDDPYLIETQLTSLRKQTGDLRLFSDQADLNELADACISLDLFSADRLVILRNPWFLYKTVTDEQINFIQHLLNGPERSHPVIISCTTKVDMRKKLATWLKKTAICHECNGFKEWEQEKISRWIINQAQEKGKKIALPASLALVELGGNNLQFIGAELEKLSVFLGQRDTISVEDIHHVSAGASGRLFQFTEAIKEKNLHNALQGMSRLLENSEDPIKLLGVLGASIRLYLQLRHGLDTHVPPATLAQRLGKNPFFLKLLTPTIQKKHSLSFLKSALHRLCEIDVQIKSGRLSAHSGLQLMVIHFCTH